jgi:hypothetical protein
LSKWTTFLQFVIIFADIKKFLLKIFCLMLGSILQQVIQLFWNQYKLFVELYVDVNIKRAGTFGEPRVEG